MRLACPICLFLIILHKVLNENLVGLDYESDLETLFGFYFFFKVFGGGGGGEGTNSISPFIDDFTYIFS